MKLQNFDDYLDRLTAALKSVRSDELNTFLGLMEFAFLQRSTVFVFGNGGSGATASHFCEDLGKGTLESPAAATRFKVLSLTDNTPYILAWANDHGYETIFEQQLRNFAEPGDVAIGISGSGNSPNVLRAIDFANRSGLITVGVTGFDGGKLAALAQYKLHVPCTDMGIVESVHVSLFHYVVTYLKAKLAELDGQAEQHRARRIELGSLFGLSVTRS